MKSEYELRRDLKPEATITTIFFDAGNTLLTPAQPEGDLFAEVAAGLGMPLDAATVNRAIPEMYRLYEQLYEQYDSFWADDARSVAIWHEMYRYLCALLDIPKVAHDHIAHAVFLHYLTPESWTTFPDVVPSLEALRARGLRLALISNWDSSLRPIIEGMGLGSLFCDIIASADVLLHKPQPAIFELALERNGAEAQNALHIGDHAIADVEGARAAGITPVYLNRDGERLEKTLSIASLTELQGIVARRR